jgi:hypothetical protein
MATYPNRPETGTHTTMRGQASDLVADVKGEVQHEAHDMRADNRPVDPSHDDHVVRRHVNGLTITFFVAIVLFLIAIIVGYLMFGHH